jgi:hypothetical protein
MGAERQARSNCVVDGLMTVALLTSRLGVHVSGNSSPEPESLTVPESRVVPESPVFCTDELPHAAANAAHEANRRRGPSKRRRGELTRPAYPSAPVSANPTLARHELRRRWVRPHRIARGDEATAWKAQHVAAKVRWRFTSEDARINCTPIPITSVEPDY